MKPSEHMRFTVQDHGLVTGLLAVVPDLGVVMQRLPGPTLKRWGAVLHHDERTVRALRGLPAIGQAWAEHYGQDERTHPAGTYGLSEAAGLPPDPCMAYSGGPDSFIIWRLLGCPDAVYLNVGNSASAQEIERVELAAKKYAQPDRPIRVWESGYGMRELSTGWIPYRNLRLILACAQVSPDVVLGRIAEWGPDKNPGFFRRTERLLAGSRGGHFQAADDLPKVRIHTPFGHMTKTALVRRYLQVFGPAAVDDLVDYTWSCYGDGPAFCGRCGGCWCRWVAFHNNGINEDRRYAQQPVRHEYYSRLHWADFRPGMVPMYVKRALEMRGLG
jgi:7-cyano-7-deazaguanine synthase in queuosine biosynthesis